MSSIRFQNSLNRVSQAVPPIWMMRQAGRYHKHYQNLRTKYSFSELCKLPEVAAEVAFGPVNEFDFDLAILFSDLLFPLEGLGMGLEYTDVGPRLGWYLTQENFKNLRSASDAISFMQFQKEAMKFTREKIPRDKSLIGFVGGSWTLFTYASMNKHDGSLTFAKSSPKLRENFLILIEEVLIQNISLQLEGGAEVVMILDTAAGELSPNLFNEIVIPFVKKASEKFPNRIGYYAKNATESLIKSVLENTNVVGIGFDHRLDLNSMIQSNQKGFTQGNFDQSLLFLETDEFKKELNLFIQRMKIEPNKRIGWVCGLGHGILPKTPEYHVKYFVDKIREEFEK